MSGSLAVFPDPNLPAAAPHRSLSRPAFLYVIAVCVALLAYEGWREWLGYEAALDRTRTETRNLAGSLRQHAEDTYEIAEQAASLVAWQATTGDPEATAAFMNQTVTTAGRLRGIHVVDATGRLVASTASHLRPGEDRSGHAYFEHHRSTPGGGTHAGQPIYSNDGAMEITVSRRIDDRNGAFAGVVVASIDPRYFADVYKAVDTGSHGVIALYDTDGTLLTRHPYRPELIGRETTFPGPSEALQVASAGNYSYRSSVDRIDRIGGWDRGTAYPLVASVAVAREDALANWSRGALLRGLGTLVLVAIIAVLGLRLADQINRRQKGERVLAQKEAEFRLLAESASDLVERFDADGNRTYISPALERLTGYAPQELLGQNAFDILAPEDRPAVEAAADRLRRGLAEQETVTFRRTRKDGVEIWLETSLRVAAEDSGRFSVVGVTRDITDRKKLEMQLEGMAMRDGLTGLANRRAFDEALAREVARCRRNAMPLALLMIDADRFKRFNDDNGHLAGDACLKAIASVVALAARRPADLAARYGGEEMALLLPDTDPISAHALANDIARQVQALGIPHQRNLPWKVVTVSIGTAAIDPHDHDAVHDGAWLISAADLALYDAKAHGRNQSIAAPRQPHARLAG